MSQPVLLGNSITLMVQCRTGANVASAADSNTVTYGIYAPGTDSPLLTGSYSTTVVNSKTGFYKSATTVAFTTGNGFAAGNTYVVRTEYAVSSSTYVDVQYITVT